MDLSVVERVFTLVGAKPALDAFADLGRELHVESLSAAVEDGRVLAKAA